MGEKGRRGKIIISDKSRSVERKTKERERDGEKTESHLCVAMATSRGVCECVVVTATGSHSP